MSAPADTIPRDYNFAADILRRNLDAGRGEKTAFIDDRGSYSYAELAERVERFGQGLRKLGARREERVLICLTDTIDWPTAFLGAIKAGVVAVPVNTLLTEDDYRFMLDDSRARALIVSEELLPKFESAIETSKNLDHRRLAGRRQADQAQGVRGAQSAGQCERRLRAHAAGALQAKARRLQISALAGIPRRAAENRDGQNPALQAKGGS